LRLSPWCGSAIACATVPRRGQLTHFEQARHSAISGEPLAVVSSHEMTEFVWDASLRDMPKAFNFPRATMADCILKSMCLSQAQLGNIHVFAGNIAPSETPGEFSRALAKWMDTMLRSRDCTDVRAQAWPHGLPGLIGEWHAQSRHVQWISVGTLGNVAIALSPITAATARPDAVVSACHQASAAAAPVTEIHVKLDPNAFTASIRLAQTSNVPLLLVLLNTSGYFCQWLTARSVEHPTLELRCFHSSMCGDAFILPVPSVATLTIHSNVGRNSSFSRTSNTMSYTIFLLSVNNHYSGSTYTGSSPGSTFSLL